MKKNFTYIAAVIDRSGSMADVLDDAIGGLNTFMKDQRELKGDCDIHLVLFDYEYIVFYSGDIAKTKDFTTETYVPRGTTALLDAIGRTIHDVGSKLDALKEDEKPEKVIVAIITDGKENCSKEFKKEKISQLIKHQQDKYKWEFLFLAADEDAIKDSRTYGFTEKNSSAVVGARARYLSMSESVTKSRTGK